jgi:hypothetical protein
MHLSQFRFGPQSITATIVLEHFNYYLSLSNHDHILFNAEILRASSIAPNHSFVDTERIEHGSPLRLPGHPMNGQPMDLEGWSGMQTEVLHI